MLLFLPRQLGIANRFSNFTTRVSHASRAWPLENCKCMRQKPQKSAVNQSAPIETLSALPQANFWWSKEKAQLSLIRFYLLRNFRRKLVPLIHVFFTLESVSCTTALSLLFTCNSIYTRPAGIWSTSLTF
jgi:hypothetical protein